MRPRIWSTADFLSVVEVPRPDGLFFRAGFFLALGVIVAALLGFGTVWFVVGVAL